MGTIFLFLYTWSLLMLNIMHYTWLDTGFCSVPFKSVGFCSGIVKQHANQLCLFRLSHDIQRSLLFGTNLATLLRHDSSKDSIKCPLYYKICTFWLAEIFEWRGLRIVCHTAFYSFFPGLRWFPLADVLVITLPKAQGELTDFWKTIPSSLRNSATQILATSAFPTSSLALINSVSLSNPV